MNEGLAAVGVGEEVKVIVLTAARTVLERRMMIAVLLWMELRDRMVMWCSVSGGYMVCTGSDVLMLYRRCCEEFCDVTLLSIHICFVSSSPSSEVLEIK